MKSAGFTILDFTINGIILGPFTENRLREKLKKNRVETLPLNMLLMWNDETYSIVNVSIL